MKLKRIIALAAAAAMVFSLAACGSNGGNAQGSAEAEGGAEKDTLIMATNAAFPPYEYVEDNEIVGIDAEIAGAIAEDLGMTLQIDDMEFDSIIPAITTGKADIGVAGMTVTEDRPAECRLLRQLCYRCPGDHCSGGFRYHFSG